MAFWLPELFPPPVISIKQESCRGWSDLWLPSLGWERQVGRDSTRWNSHAGGGNPKSFIRGGKDNQNALNQGLVTFSLSSAQPSTSTDMVSYQQHTGRESSLWELPELPGSCCYCMHLHWGHSWCQHGAPGSVTECIDLL